jgi:hypothetical protein
MFEAYTHSTDSFIAEALQPEATTIQELMIEQRNALMVEPPLPQDDTDVFMPSEVYERFYRNLLVRLLEQPPYDAHAMAHDMTMKYLTERAVRFLTQKHPHAVVPGRSLPEGEAKVAQRARMVWQGRIAAVAPDFANLNRSKVITKTYTAVPRNMNLIHSDVGILKPYAKSLARYIELFPHLFSPNEEANFFLPYDSDFIEAHAEMSARAGEALHGLATPQVLYLEYGSDAIQRFSQRTLEDVVPTWRDDGPQMGSLRQMVTSLRIQTTT